MINSGESGKREARPSAAQDDGSGDRPVKPTRRANAAGSKRPDRAAGAKSLAAGVNRVAGVRRAPTAAVERGAALGEPVAQHVRRAATGSVERGRAAAGQANKAGRAAAAAGIEQTRDAPRGVASATKAVADEGRAAAGGIGGLVGRLVTREVLMAAVGVTKDVVGAVGSTLQRLGAGAALSFLIGRALLLLELIKRLVRLALSLALNGLQQLARRLQDANSVTSSAASTGDA